MIMIHLSKSTCIHFTEKFGLRVTHVHVLPYAELKKKGDTRMPPMSPIEKALVVNTIS